MSDRIMVGTRKGLFTLRRGKHGWKLDDRVEFRAAPTSMVLHDPRDDSLFAALNHGHFGVKLHRSHDGGATWAEVDAPKFPRRPDDAPEELDPMGKVVPWKVKDVWALAAGGADQPGRIWCGTIPGALFRSDDGGSSWTFVESLWHDELRKQWVGGGADSAAIHSICVDPRDSAKVTIGVSVGGVWRTTDHGETWHLHGSGMRASYMPPDQAFEPISQDPHSIVQCPAAPDVLWCQHHNGIFRSTDGGVRWNEIEQAGPSTFGFAVAVHPHDPDTAWFVPAQKDEFRIPVDGKVVVTRTRDGGRTFDVLTEGLPQRHAYDLVFRHAMDIDASGDRLAFGSSTGSLWVTDDGGDRWTEVSSHLPQIYCVRFA